MKKAIIILLFFLSITLVFSQSNTIRITNGDWEPFLSETLPNHGLYSHVVSEAFKMEGITVEWGFFPWARSYDYAKAGTNWDASAVWWPSDDAKEDFYISDPVGETSFVFFHLKSKDFDWNSFSDLRGLTVGGTREYAYGADFDRAVENGTFTLVEGSQDEVNFKKILGGRIDIFPNDPIVGYAQIRNNFSTSEVERFTHHEKEFEVSTLSLIISKNSPNASYYLRKFNSGLKKLKDSGKYDQMFRDLNNGAYD